MDIGCSDRSGRNLTFTLVFSSIKFIIPCKNCIRRWKKKMKNKKMLSENFLHLARVALSERTQDVQAFLYRIAKSRDTDPEISKALIELLRKNPTRVSPLRDAGEVAVPVDMESRFQLVRLEEKPVLAHEPVYTDEVRIALERLVQEREKISVLLEAGLDPTRTVLFTGPPGVGKTLAAKWIARETGRPLLTLDLSAVMSSYLGRTGSNLRYVLDYAKSVKCVLLLDELDAVAKKRDDFGEIGELKRLVTVLLQELDDWPPSGLLIAATNHSNLLDPAVWRRFEQQVDFPLPEREEVRVFISGLLSDVAYEARGWTEVLSLVLSGHSFSDIEREINLARRAAALNEEGLDLYLAELVNVEGQSKRNRIDLAVELVRNGLASQRAAHEITGVARDTIREWLKTRDDKKGG